MLISKQFICNKCSKNFIYNSSLNRHIKEVHESSGKLENCSECKSKFKSKSGLARHMKKRHPYVPLTHSKDSESKVNCALCKGSFIKNEIIHHYSEHHGIEIECENLQFKNIDEFKEWKKKLENEQHVFYTVFRANYIVKDGGSKMTYRCHHDGIFKKRGLNIRHKKKKLTKINAHCPAKMKVNVLSDGLVSVYFHKTHVGHSLENSRREVSRERSKNSKEYKENVNSDSFTISGTDLLPYNELLSTGEYLELENFCNETVFKGTNSNGFNWLSHPQTSKSFVRFYKASGCSMIEYPQLEIGDFILIIANDDQLDILKEFGEECICFERTQDLNCCKLQLISLWIIDDRKEGFPCAFLFTSRCDTYIISIFISTLRAIIGSKLQPKVLMSDMTDCFYKSWSLCSVILPETRLFSSWHVDRDWRKNLSEIVKRKKQIQIYKTLRLLVEEKNTVNFRSRLDQFVNELTSDPDTVKFSLYFTVYEETVNEWAFCYRQELNLNNLQLEKLQKSIEYIYLKGKCQIENVIYGLYRFVHNKLSNVLLEKPVIEINKLTNILSRLREFHNISDTLDLGSIIQCEDKLEVIETDEKYEIAILNLSCQCDFRCGLCNYCIHAFMCSCPESVVKWNMCKHVHLISKLNQNQEVVSTLIDAIPDDCSFVEENSGINTETVIYTKPDIDFIIHGGDENQLVEPFLKSREASKRKSLTRDEYRNVLLKKLNQLLDDASCDEDFEIIEKQLIPCFDLIEERRRKRNQRSKSNEEDEILL